LAIAGCGLGNFAARCNLSTTGRARNSLHTDRLRYRQPPYHRAVDFGLLGFTVISHGALSLNFISVTLETAIDLLSNSKLHHLDDAHMLKAPMSSSVLITPPPSLSAAKHGQ
jgi:hypothetical protein